MKRIVLAFLAADMFCAVADEAHLGIANGLEAYQLRCEKTAVAPVGIACAQPRLTWSLSGDEPAARPTFAEVCLANADGSAAGH